MNWISELNSKHGRKYSQAGQDGLVEFVFQNIGTTNKFCVEFGFNTDPSGGRDGSNTARLVFEDGWEALLLDGYAEGDPAINFHKQLLTYENIGPVFKKYNVPTEPDYVSIDVDGIDLWLLKGILEAGYRPRLISVEYNCAFPPGIMATLKNEIHHWENDAVYGASLSALSNVAQEFGYKLVVIESGLDLFFLRNDLGEGQIDPGQIKLCCGFRIHNVPTAERKKLMVSYPSLEPLAEWIE